MRKREEMIVLLLQPQGGGEVFVVFTTKAASATGAPDGESFKSAIVSRHKSVGLPATRSRKCGLLK
jgi:hypothetical protein